MDDITNLVRLDYVNGSVYVGTFICSVFDKDQNGKMLKANAFDKLWLVIRSLRTNSYARGYRLAEGDVIRMGRMKFRVIEIKGGADRPAPVNLSELLLGVEPEEAESDEEEEGIMQFNLPCRICWSHDFTIENPLISPCICDGTMKYIHLKCL